MVDLIWRKAKDLGWRHSVVDPGVKCSKDRVEMPVPKPGQPVQGHGGTSQDTSAACLPQSDTMSASGGFRERRIDHL